MHIYYLLFPVLLTAANSLAMENENNLKSKENKGKEKVVEKETVSKKRESLLNGSATLNKPMEFNEENEHSDDDKNEMPIKVIVVSLKKALKEIAKLHNQVAQLNRQIDMFSANEQAVKKYELRKGNLDPELLEVLWQCWPAPLKSVANLMYRYSVEPTNKLLRTAATKKILLVGPPGAGKSDAAEALGQNANILIVKESGAGIPTSYKNSGIANLDALFLPLFARAEPSLVFIDELKGIIDRKGDNDSDKSMIPHLQYLIDELDKHPQVFLVITANKIKDLPGPLKDRFHECIIQMTAPDENARTRAVLYFLEELSDLNENDLKIKPAPNAFSIVERLNGFSCRQIKYVIKQAAAFAVEKSREKILRDDLENAITIVYQNLCLTHDPYGEEFEEDLKLKNQILSNRQMAVGIIAASNGGTGRAEYRLFSYDSAPLKQ